MTHLRRYYERNLICPSLMRGNNKESTWVFKVGKVDVVGMTEVLERCIRLFALIARKNAKSLSNQEKTVRFIARIVSQSIKTAADRAVCQGSFKARQRIAGGFFYGRSKVNITYVFLITLLICSTPALAQDAPSANDTVQKMQHDLNLSGDQVAGITQVEERYAEAMSDLQKSIDDNTINPSVIDSQRKGIKAQEEQGIAQYLRSDQVYQWGLIQHSKEQYNGGREDNGQDDYSNLPSPKGQ